MTIPPSAPEQTAAARQFADHWETRPGFEHRECHLLRAAHPDATLADLHDPLTMPQGGTGAAGRDVDAGKDAPGEGKHG